MPRALSSRAIPSSVPLPAARISSITGNTLAVWRSALALMASTAATLPLAARRNAAAPLTLPSRCPRALAAASAAFGFRHVRGNELRPAVLQCRDECEFAAPAVELGDHEGCPGYLASVQCLLSFGRSSLLPVSTSTNSA